MKKQVNGNRLGYGAGHVSSTRIQEGEELADWSVFEPNIAPDTSFSEKQGDYNTTTMLYTEENTPVIPKNKPTFKQ